MFLQIRRALAAIGLMAVLLLAFPAPSRAAGSPGAKPVHGVTERIWAWLEGLLLGTPAPPAPSRGKEGSMIDPDGHKVLGLLSVPTIVITSDEGSMIDPDGLK